jgi:hypothetical protein
MTDIDDILNNATQWTTESVTKPTIKEAQLHSLAMMTRGIIVSKIRSDDALTGVIDRNKYSVNSHDMWSVGIVDSTDAGREAIVGCVKRIIAEYSATTTETYLDWEGGEYSQWNGRRFEFYFVILRKKSVIAEF